MPDIIEDILTGISNIKGRLQLQERQQVKRNFEEMIKWRKGIEVHNSSDAIPIRPERILSEVRSVLPEDGIVVTDVGWNKNGLAQQFPIFKPMTHLTPSGLATMGFGPAAAIGAKIGAPDKESRHSHW